MTKRLPALLMTTVLLSSCGNKPDPVAVDPAHYKVAFENDRVRVLHAVIGPHEKTPRHYHPDSVVIVVAGDRGRDIFEDGKVGEPADNPPGAGWSQSGLHAVENVGEKPMERYIVEFKKR